MAVARHLDCAAKFASVSGASDDLKIQLGPTSIGSGSRPASVNIDHLGTGQPGQQPVRRTLAQGVTLQIDGSEAGAGPSGLVLEGR